MDTIIGHGHQGVLLTAIERYFRLTRILVLPHRQARFIALATIEMLLPYRPWVHTITVDNGLEIASHHYAAKVLNNTPTSANRTTPGYAVKLNNSSASSAAPSAKSNPSAICPEMKSPWKNNSSI